MYVPIPEGEGGWETWGAEEGGRRAAGRSVGAEVRGGSNRGGRGGVVEDQEMGVGGRGRR